MGSAYGIRAASAVVAVLALAACGDDATPVEERFDERPQLADCGRIDVGLEPWEPALRGTAELDCLHAAVADPDTDGVELTVSMLSDEGDPVYYHLRAIGDGRVEAYVDSRQDSFSSRRLVREVLDCGVADDRGLAWAMACPPSAADG